MKKIGLVIFALMLFNFSMSEIHGVKAVGGAESATSTKPSTTTTSTSSQLSTELQKFVNAVKQIEAQQQAIEHSKGGIEA